MEQVLKYPGSKWRLAEWVVRQLPPHKTYLEPFFGSGAVLFSKPPAKLETINDLDENVVNLFRVIRDHGSELAELVYYTPWARSEYNSICDPVDVLIKTGEPVEDARRFLVRLWQAFGSKTCYTTGWRNNVQGSLGASGIGVWKRVPERILGCMRGYVTSRLSVGQQ